MVGPQKNKTKTDKRAIDTWVCACVHGTLRNIGFLCMQSDDEECAARCTRTNPWLTRDWKKWCFRRRQKWLENARRFHPWRYRPALSGTSHRPFFCVGEEKWRVLYAPGKEKNNNRRCQALQLSSSLSSFSSCLPRAHLHSLLHLFFAARCQATDRKEHHLETSNSQEELAGGRRHIRRIFRETDAEVGTRWKVFLYSLHNPNPRMWIFIRGTCSAGAATTDCTDGKQIGDHVEVFRL